MDWSQVCGHVPMNNFSDQCVKDQIKFWQGKDHFNEAETLKLFRLSSVL